MEEGRSELDRQNAAARNTFKSVTFAPSLSISASFTPSWVVAVRATCPSDNQNGDGSRPIFIMLAWCSDMSKLHSLSTTTQQGQISIIELTTLISQVGTAEHSLYLQVANRQVKTSFFWGSSFWGGNRSSATVQLPFSKKWLLQVLCKTASSVMMHKQNAKD